MIFVLLNSLLCPLYHHVNNSILTIGYLFMRGMTFDKLEQRPGQFQALAVILHCIM